MNANRALLVLLLASAASAQDARPPGVSEQRKLVAEYFTLDPRTPAERARQRQIEARLGTVPPLRASDERSWRKKLDKAFRKGRRLEASAGTHHYWTEPRKRGLYIVGGKISRRPKGLLIGMHGGGRGSGSASSAHGMLDSAARKLGLVAIYPQVLERTEHGWTDSGTEAWVLDLIAAARRTWKIHPDHIYFAGHSMGGYGTWTLGAHHADLVAGLAPSAGSATPILDSRTHEPVDIVEGIIPCLRNVRLAIYQSDDDPRVPPGGNRAAAAKLAEAKKRWGGFDYEYWEVSGRGHAGPPGGAIALLEKVVSATREPRPPVVVWQPSLPWKRQFYWLYWENPVPTAIVEARLDPKDNAVRVTASTPPKGLEVLLAPDMLDLEREVTVFLGDRAVFRGVPEASLATLVRTARRGDPELTFAVGIPLDG